MEKILIVGSKGFIGSHAFNFFSGLQGYECWGCDKMVDYNNPRYFLIENATADFNDIFESIEFDYCINCSGAASVADSLVHPLRDFSLNVSTVAKLLEGIRRHRSNCKFIQLSSAAVYGNPSTLPVSIDAQPGPLSPYGMHKMYSELLCKEYTDHFQVKSLSLRIFSAYGPGLRKQLFWDWYNNSRECSSIILYGSGNESRDFIYIDDLMQVLQLCIKQGAFDGGVVNVANGEEIFIKEVAAIFLGLLNKRYIFNNQIRQGDPVNWVADISHLKTWGYVQNTSLKEGLKKYIEWAAEQSLA